MPKTFYPLLIFTLLGSFLVFSGWSAYRAATYGSQISDRDYYSKGLKYNATRVEKRAASVLGWQLTTSLNKQQLQILLFDGKGVPVEGAEGKLTFFHPAEDSINSLTLTEFAPGTYLTQLPDSFRGEIAVRIDIERRGARLNRQLLLNL